MLYISGNPRPAGIAIDQTIAGAALDALPATSLTRIDANVGAPLRCSSCSAIVKQGKPPAPSRTVASPVCGGAVGALVTLPAAAGAVGKANALEARRSNS
jgi:hypothetical protein